MVRGAFLSLEMTSEIPIEVAVRVRPLIEDEQLQSQDPSLYCDVEESSVIIGNDKQFQFDYVFDAEAGQVEVYESIVAPLIQPFFDGYNVTVFAYGQTGTGKTYTMGTGNYVYLNEVEQGIIPRAISEIFKYQSTIRENVVCKFSVSFIEIYREETTDLLAHAPKALRIRDDVTGNTIMVGACEEIVHTCDDVLTLLDAGTAMRHVGSTNINETSSRSHCIFTLTLEQYSLEETDKIKAGAMLSSRFHFVDLAGSERAHRTGNQGQRFKESVSINSGLLALGNVIGALSDPRRKSIHVPYRESKLTRLLKDSLGGNSRTVMITCLSPVLADLDENINSLKYASRAKKIRNKPIVNRNREGSKMVRMEKEIQALRTHLQHRHLVPSNVNNDIVDDDEDDGDEDIHKFPNLQMQNEKQDVIEQDYLKSFQEINDVINLIQMSVNLPPFLAEKIKKWRNSWHYQHQKSDRPISAPSISSSARVPSSNDINENLLNHIAKYKKQELEWESAMELKTRELDELRQEVIAFGEENAKLRLDLDITINTNNELRDRVFEQQIALQQMRSRSGSSKGRQTGDQPIPNAFYSQDRVMQRFRVKNDLLMSQIDDMDQVEHDEELSSDEETPRLLLRKYQSEPAVMKTKSAIPVLATGKHHQRPSSMKQLKTKPFIGTEDDQDSLTRLESSRNSFILGAKTAEINVREAASRLKELEASIRQKEQLIAELLQSEQIAKATSTIYQEKLSKLEKDYEKAKKELDDATARIKTNEENGDATDKNNAQNRAKLEKDYNRKYKTAQKKLDTLKRKETASTRITTYQQNNEKRIKDLEANIARMKNLHNELERRLKSETDKKGKYEQEIHKNELRIKELELKTDQQQKILKRKTEEVLAAQRKLRVNDQNSKVNEELDKKKVWIDEQIEKILSRQKDISLLEAELRDRDISLKKKEALLKEKDFLEIKKSKSSVNLSKDIVKLSVKMDTVDEQIEEHTNRGGDCSQLQMVKSELAMQKGQLDQLVERGGLEAHEERRLIELGEALEAVEEAIQYKNDRIARKQLNIAEEDLDHYRNVELLLNNMGELSKTEYKHLLGKFFLRIIELRQMVNNADETRYHFEMKVSNQEKKIQDMDHVIGVMETRHERVTMEMLTKHEKEMQFLMAQLRNEEMGHVGSMGPHEMTGNPGVGGLDKRVKYLEKELYYYKLKSRKYKDKLKDFSNNISIDTEDATEPSELHQRKTIIEDLHIEGLNESLHEGGVHLPPVKHPGWVIEPKDSEKRLMQINTSQVEEAKRLQEIFESKLPASQAIPRLKKKENGFKKRSSGELSYIDSIEVVSKNPWH